MAGPMAGVKVVELGVWIAGPATGGILADWGADVVKLEPPSGDPCRMFQRMLGGRWVIRCLRLCLNWSGKRLLRQKKPTALARAPAPGPSKERLVTLPLGFSATE